MKNILEIKRAEKQRREENFAEKRYQEKIRFADLTQTHCYIAFEKQGIKNIKLIKKQYAKLR